MLHQYTFHMMLEQVKACRRSKKPIEQTGCRASSATQMWFAPFFWKKWDKYPSMHAMQLTVLQLMVSMVLALESITEFMVDPCSVVHLIKYPKQHKLILHSFWDGGLERRISCWLQRNYWVVLKMYAERHLKNPSLHFFNLLYIFQGQGIGGPSPGDCWVKVGSTLDRMPVCPGELEA